MRFAGLDVLRAVAILWVMAFHAQTMSLGVPLLGLTEWGWVGVDLFFVLSGFLIGRQWLAGSGVGAFYRRRLFRIVPAYAVVVAAYFAVPQCRERPQIQPLWQFLTFTENLFIDARGGKAFSHVWSLCVEEHFYLLFPMIAFALTRRPSRAATMVVLAVLVFGGMAWRAHVWFDLLAGLEERDLGKKYLERIYYPTPCRLDGLVAGVTLAVIERYSVKTWAALMARPRVLFGAAVLFAAVTAAVFWEAPSAGAAVVGYPVLALAMGCLVASACSERAWVNRLWVPGAGGIAAISYSLYLTHKIAFHLVHDWAGEWLGSHDAVAWVTYPAVALVVGLGLHWAVERPALWLRGWVERRGRAAAAAPG